MAHDLEYPGAAGVPGWGNIYRARGDEIAHHRPIFTGDVFERVPVQDLGQINTSVIVLQHPCALRSNGTDLQSRLMVGKVNEHEVISVEQWTRYFNLMPLPDLYPSATLGKRHQAASFDELYLVGPDYLDPNKRVACLSQTGVNLLLQRWVHFNSRAVIPTWIYQQVSSPFYEEADLIEEWTEQRLEVGMDIREATAEAKKWLREDAAGVTRQKLLEEPQSRSTVRRQLRVALRKLR